jgi:hypothetical protein|tara:strand:- start:2304 stop:2804 length:501 start_codon:yes stop_codon:yes gene_type:complete
MIQSTIKTPFNAIINTTANQIEKGAIAPPNADPHNTLRYLFKFTNDMSGEVIYCYPTPLVYNRYSTFHFESICVSPIMFEGQLCIALAGYWKYEVYEVYFEEQAPYKTEEYYPKNEDDILPASPDHGIVKGLVAIGKMYAAEIGGEEQVQYKEYIAPVKTNYIYNE